MLAQFIKKNNRTDNTGKIKQQVCILMLERPLGAFG